MGNSVITRLSAIDESGKNLLGTVETDSQPSGAEGGLHVFDAQGHVADITFAGSSAANGDDVYSGSVPLTDKRLAGFDKSTMQATGFVDVPNYGRVWEGGINYAVKQQAVDRVESVGSGFPTSPAQRTGTLASGKLTLGYAYGAYGDDANGQWDWGLSNMNFDNGYFFGNPTTLQVVMTPIMTNMQERNFTRGDDTQTIKTYALDNEAAKVTLYRQSDGSYSASAPNGKGFFHITGFDDFDAGDAYLKLSGVNVAIVDPKTGQWDSNYSQNYWIPAP